MKTPFRSLWWRLGAFGDSACAERRSRKNAVENVWGVRIFIILEVRVMLTDITKIRLTQDFGQNVFGRILSQLSEIILHDTMKDRANIN